MVEGVKRSAHTLDCPDTFGLNKSFFTFRKPVPLPREGLLFENRTYLSNKTDEWCSKKKQYTKLREMLAASLTYRLQCADVQTPKAVQDDANKVNTMYMQFLAKAEADRVEAERRVTSEAETAGSSTSSKKRKTIKNAASTTSLRTPM
jgi:hypothetical protein